MKKDISHEEADKQQSLFIFYTPVSEDSKIDLNKSFPTGWWWVGSGLTYPICNTKKGGRGCAPPTKYTNEIQFMGPDETRKSMKDFLNKNFARLKKNKAIKFYKIQDTYRPVPV